MGFNVNFYFLVTFLNKQKPSLVFNHLRCYSNNTHLSQNTRINTSVVNLDSYKNGHKSINSSTVVVNKP